MLRAVGRVGFHGYCPTSGHVQLTATQKPERSHAIAIWRTRFLRVEYLDRLHGRRGKLWQNRCCSCAPEEAHFVHLNNRFIPLECASSAQIDQVSPYDHLFALRWEAV